MTSFTARSRVLCLGLALLMLSMPVLAKDVPLQVVDWPDTGTPAVRFTFGKFRPLDGMASVHGFQMEITAQNLSTRLIASEKFRLYLFDKNKVRVGEDVIALSNMGPGETVKFQTTVMASGTPLSVTLQEVPHVAPLVTLTVNSTPQGALLKVDGTEAGTTPRIIKVGPGKHTLLFSKEGFNVGTFPLEISADDLSGGTVSYELGSAAFDSIELRNGSVLNGDLVSVSGMDVEMRIGGQIQHMDRNKIKRILLTQRDPPPVNLPPSAALKP